MDDTNLSIVKVDNIKKFWLSFTTWFEDELPGTGILKAYYEDYDNWNGGIYYLGIDFEKEYRLHYGIDYSDILKLEVPQMEDIKMFIELTEYVDMFPQTNGDILLQSILVWIGSQKLTSIWTYRAMWRLCACCQGKINKCEKTAYFRAFFGGLDLMPYS